MYGHLGVIDRHLMVMWLSFRRGTSRRWNKALWSPKALLYNVFGQSRRHLASDLAGQSRHAAWSGE